MKKLMLTMACVILAGVSFANHWTPIGGTQYNMTMSGIIIVDGVEQMSTTLEVGAFCGEECRGSMLPEFFPPSAQYVVSLTVVSNQMSGEEITFRLYDHAAQQELNLVSVNDITFESNAIIGTLGDWYEFSFETVASGGNHWTPIGGTQYNMTMSGIILIDGVEQMNTTLEVGAFCGDECRGSMLPEFFPPSAQYVVSLTVVSNQMSGEEITFRLYDHAIQQELDLVSVNDITFESNAIIGTLGDWYEFSFITPSSTQTYTLPITGFGESNGNYYLIAPPFDNIDPAEVEGMTDNVFDLYYFDQSQTLEWQNYKNHTFNLESGKGYLYAHKTDILLSFTGTPYSGNGIVYLDYDANCELKGWNLVGNPFGQTVYIDRDYYTTNTEGTDIIVGNGNAIAAMQGIFVVAASDGEEMVFSTEAPTNTENKLVLNIRNNRGNVIDRALIRFGQGRQLPKFMLNEDNTKLYIQQADNDYAAVVRSEDENAMSVNFKAAENGVYTLSIASQYIELDYLHLIDNITGADINLLQTPNYTFEANTTDYANRFNLVYKKNTGIEEHDQRSFCIVNGKSLLFCEDAEGATFSLFDMSGRTVCKETLQSNQMSLVGLSGGVYVVRLNKGNELKTQKIVLK